jgi:hypothetical protein
MVGICLAPVIKDPAEVGSHHGALLPGIQRQCSIPEERRGVHRGCISVMYSGIEFRGEGTADEVTLIRTAGDDEADGRRPVEDSERRWPEARGLEEAQLAGARDGAETAPHLQLAVDVMQVPLHGEHTQEELHRDLLVREPLGQQTQHFPLPLAQRFT